MKVIDKFKEMRNYVESCGVKINTNTKARGHQGFFMNGRIDISNVLTDERKCEVLVHEFSHYVHFLIEPDVLKTHGKLECIFKTQNVSEIEKELINITYGKGNIAALEKLKSAKMEVVQKIKVLDKNIKEKYPSFKRSEPFKPIEKVIKKTDAKYLLKYDRVKVKGGWFRKDKVFSVYDVGDFFPDFESYIADYILIKSQQRLQRRLSSRISRLNKYYCRPSELFARFVEGIYRDEELIKRLAPVAYKRFFELVDEGYYPHMSDFF